MSIHQEANAFIQANDESPVISGYAIEPDPRRPAQGAVYELDDGRSFRLSRDVCRALPADYPKWKVA